MCVCVCVNPQLSRALSYFILLLCHKRSGSYWKFVGSMSKVRQARLVLCCLDGERVVANDDNSVLAISDR